MEGWEDGTTYWVEGTVKNMGTVLLRDVRLEVEFYDDDGVLVKAISAPAEPSSIDVWETAHCKVELQGKKGLIKGISYTLATVAEHNVR
ncbi:FxLYD domain-containing protein [Chloroflexota bacterium]